MGYQESFVFVSKKNIEKNRQGIEKILAMFQKYGIRCVDDMWADCCCRLHFNKQVGEFKEGMEMLVVSGERSVQRSPYVLFALNESPELTREEFKFIRKIEIVPIEKRWDILEAEKADAITVEKIELHPDKELNGFVSLEEKLADAKVKSEQTKDSIQNSNKYYKTSDGWFDYYVNVATGEKKLKLGENDVCVEQKFDDFYRDTVKE